MGRTPEREKCGLRFKTAELNKRDNLQLAQRAKTIIAGFLQIYDEGLMGEADLL